MMSYLPLLRRSDLYNRLLNLGGDLRRRTMIHIMTVIRIHIDKQMIIVLNRYVLLLGDSDVLNAYSKFLLEQQS